MKQTPPAHLRARLTALLPLTALALALGGCDLKHPTDNLVRGKQLFVAKCASCHTLSHAGSNGVIGPNLDQSFLQSHTDGLKRNDYRGVIDYQIRYPNPYGAMPANLYQGGDAGDVAGYVAAVAAAPGQDTGALANAVPSINQKPAVESAGKLEVDADPSGQLKFLASSATATAGNVTLRMINKSSVPHDIAVTGGGANQIGAIVQGGGVSTVSVKLAAGTYTFYCSVPGHREAGMQGKLVVK